MAKKVERRVATIELAGARVPSIMLLPELDAPVPAVLLLHGYSSSKERLSNTMGRALAARGIASLAIDLPLHGTREDAMITQARTNPLGLLQHWQMALAEARHAIAWLVDNDAIDPLIQMLSDKDWFTRLTAAAALESIGDERGREALKPLMKDPDMVVKMRVERILAKWKKQPTSQPANA